jgi:hypothetical protein
MTQLYSDLVDGSGRRYYFSLSRATGGLAPAAPAAVTVMGLQPTVSQIVIAFRTPTQATVTIAGYQPPSLTPVQPGVASISFLGLIPTEQKIRIVTPAMPAPDYSTPNELIPTIAFIQTVSPATAAISIQSLALNAFPGGDIVYITPGVAALTLTGLQAAVVNNQPNVASISISGLIPGLKTETVVQPDVASITIDGLALSADRGFVWTTVVTPAPIIWTTTTVSAA